MTGPNGRTGNPIDSVSTRPTPEALSSVVWAALRGPHRAFAQTVPHLPGPEVLATRYPHDITPFAALSDTDSAAAWDQLKFLVKPGDHVAVIGENLRPPSGWNITSELRVAQLTGPNFISVPDDQLARPGDDLVELTQGDVPEMLQLVELTQPGPFAARTIELGGYVGIRWAGQLVAMAGRRFQVPGWIEVSAVCTHPDHRGRGLSRRLMNAVIGGIRDGGQLPFLHVVTENPAVSLYERLGFDHHLEATVYALEPHPTRSPVSKPPR